MNTVDCPKIATLIQTKTRFALGYVCSHSWLSWHSMSVMLAVILGQAGIQCRSCWSPMMVTLTSNGGRVGSQS